MRCRLIVFLQLHDSTARAASRRCRRRLHRCVECRCTRHSQSEIVMFRSSIIVSIAALRTIAICSQLGTSRLRSIDCRLVWLALVSLHRKSNFNADQHQHHRDNLQTNDDKTLAPETGMPPHPTPAATSPSVYAAADRAAASSSSFYAPAPLQVRARSCATARRVVKPPSGSTTTAQRRLAELCCATSGDERRRVTTSMSAGRSRS